MSKTLDLTQLKQAVNPTGNVKVNIEFNIDGEDVNADVYVRNIPVGEVYNNETLETKDVFEELFKRIHKNILNEDGTRFFDTIDQIKSMTNKSLIRALGDAIGKVNNLSEETDTGK